MNYIFLSTPLGYELNCFECQCNYQSSESHQYPLPVCQNDDQGTPVTCPENSVCFDAHVQIENNKTIFRGCNTLNVVNMVVDIFFPNTEVQENDCVTVEQGDKIGKICTCTTDYCNSPSGNTPTTITIQGISFLIGVF